MKTSKDSHAVKLFFLVLVVGIAATVSALKKSKLPAVEESSTLPNRIIAQAPVVEAGGSTSKTSSAPQVTDDQYPQEVLTDDNNDMIVSAQNFSAYANKTLKLLPTKKDLAGLSAEDVHETPVVLIAKSRRLVAITQALADDPSLADQAMDFFETCSLDSDISSTIRARCLSNLIKLKKEKGQDVDLSSYSPTLVRLASFIP